MHACGTAARRRGMPGFHLDARVAAVREPLRLGVPAPLVARPWPAVDVHDLPAPRNVARRSACGPRCIAQAHAHASAQACARICTSERTHKRTRTHAKAHARLHAQKWGRTQNAHARAGTRGMGRTHDGVLVPRRDGLRHVRDHRQPVARVDHLRIRRSPAYTDAPQHRAHRPRARRVNTAACNAVCNAPPRRNGYRVPRRGLAACPAAGSPRFATRRGRRCGRRCGGAGPGAPEAALTVGSILASA